MNDVRLSYTALDDLALRQIDSTVLLDISRISRAFLIIYAVWSGSGISNLNRTVELLKRNGCVSDILLADIDNISADIQTQILGYVCQGWSEIFMIEQGIVARKFVGKSCYKDLREYLN